MKNGRRRRNVAGRKGETRSGAGGEKPYDIGVRIVRLVEQLPRTVAGYAVGRQIVRSGTSVGANVEEADAAEHCTELSSTVSKRDFIHKMSIARKEAKETRFWLRIILETPLLDTPKVHALLQESDELIRILSTIIINAKKKP